MARAMLYTMLSGAIKREARKKLEKEILEKEILELNAELIQFIKNYKIALANQADARMKLLNLLKELDKTMNP